MTDPLKLAEELDACGATTGKSTDRMYVFHPDACRLLAAALRLAEKIEDPWVRGRHPWWRCIICGAECEWDEESEFPGTHRPGCEFAAWDAEREGS